ncbi:MAG: hypothetical protein AABP62_23905 [Planctomycetota bacterium]
MSDKVRTFCDHVQDKLTTLDGRMNSLKLNSGPTWHFLQEKLDEIRDRGEADRPAIHQARTKLEQWCDDRKSEATHTIDHWRKNRETTKLAERAQRAEEHARYAMQIAEASIDTAEQMILEAISARLDAESVTGDDLPPEIGPFVPRERTKTEIRPMKSVDIISEEHAVVERVLEMLEQACACIRHGESPPIGFKRWAIEFFFLFANRCRDSRAASVRSPVFQFRGVSSDGGPVGVMRAHHKQGRSLIERLQLAVDQHDHAGWSLLAGEYALLLRQQFQHEKRVLLQMAEVCGTEQDHAELAEIFRSVDCAQGGHELGKQFDGQIEKWEQQFRASALSGPSLAMSAYGESMVREMKPNFAGTLTEISAPRTIGEHSLDIRDCETDMTTLKSLMFDRTELPEDTSDAGRKAPRKSK